MYGKSFLTVLISMLIASAISCDDSGDNGEPQQTRGRTVDPETEVLIYDDRGDTVTTVNAAVARTSDERSTGLMDVHDMPFDTGMLFLFDSEEPLSFWMANTPLSLDIIFMDRNREIVRIRSRTTPYSDRQVTSGVPAQYVLEVNAGFAQEYDIREGMHMDWD